MVKEVIFTDNHGSLDVYDTLDSILSSEEVDRVFHCGDLKSLFSPEKKSEMLERAYNSDDFAQHSKNVKDFRQLNLLLEDLAFREELKADYGPQNNAVKALKEKFGVDFKGVPGNWDGILLSQFIPEIDWLTESQSLSDEFVFGAMGSLEIRKGDVYGPVDPSTRRFRYIWKPDEDYEDFKKSKIYNSLKDKRIDVLVSHHSGDFGGNIPIEIIVKDGVRIPVKGGAGKGIEKLGQENPGMVNYCGHLHDGLIYRDPRTDVLILRPGQNHVFHVEREGKEVKWVKIYKVDKSA
ncbi:hypothetical protein B6U93_02760 [Candidatus Woesearchaeota archaeon ex4484_78]|nr:MAG: hypothetical protein B6U93_02760 [Candidatus Woesearchaeota archaeon ex4484_78]